MKLSVSALLLALTATASATAIKKQGLVPKDLLLDKLPDSGEQWQSLKNGVEFQPAPHLSPLAQEHLRRMVDKEYNTERRMEQPEGTYAPTNAATSAATSAVVGFDSSMSKIYLDGAETYYDEYSQAWRAMGFYIDCDQAVFEKYYNGGDNQGRGRKLQDDDRDGCQRFMLWAAYIDEEYSGGEIHEYRYYNRKIKSWNDSCEQDDDEQDDDEQDDDEQDHARCVKMDCHLPNTHFTLLGYFKEPNYDEWMEQLFKHEGDCVWTDSEYRFMQQNREAWPNGCSATDYTDQDGNVIYMDVKPASSGGMDIALYLDDLCIVEATGDLSAHTVVKDMICNSSAYDDGQDGCGGGQRDLQEDDYNGDDANAYAYGYYSCFVTQYKRAETKCNVCGGYACSNFTAYFNTSTYDEMVANMTYIEDNYQGDQHNLDEAAGGGGDGDDIWTLDTELDTWNSAFDIFKQCLPCKAGQLTKLVSGEEANAYGDRYDTDLNDNADGDQDDDQDGDQDDGGGRRRRRMQDDGDDDDFHCHDDAGYDNVNQCMKFATHTRMVVATWRDVEMAASQGTLTSVSIAMSEEMNTANSGNSKKIKVTTIVQSLTYENAYYGMAWTFLVASAVLFGACMWKLKRAGDDSSDIMKEPLVARRDNELIHEGELL